MKDDGVFAGIRENNCGSAGCACPGGNRAFVSGADYKYVPGIVS